MIRFILNWVKTKIREYKRKKLLKKKMKALKKNDPFIYYH